MKRENVIALSGGVGGAKPADRLVDAVGDGRLAVIAVQGGTKAQLDVGAVLRKRLSIDGSTLRPRSVAYKTALARDLRQRVWPLLESGRIKPVVHRVFPALEAAQAHRLMESSTHVGKIVLDWQGVDS